MRLEIPRISIRLRDPARLWVRKAPDAHPELIDLRGPPGSIIDALSAHVTAPGDVSSGDAAHLELAVRALPYFLGIPLSASSGAWEFRTLTAPPDIPVPADLEVAPLGPAPIGGCVLFPDPSTGLLARAVYARRFPEPRKEPLVVSFESPVTVGGVTIFSRRLHEETRKPDEEPVLFSWARRAPPPQPWALEERISGIAFIAEEEMVREECPLPGDTPAMALLEK